MVRLIFIRHDTKQYVNMDVGIGGPSVEKPLLDPSLIDIGEEVCAIRYKRAYDYIRAFEKNGRRDTVVICSPYARTVQTMRRFIAHTALVEQGVDLISINPDVRAFSGHQVKNIRRIMSNPVDHVIQDTLEKRISYPRDIFESMEDFNIRVKMFVYSIFTSNFEYYKDKTVIVFSHGFFIKRAIETIKRVAGIREKRIHTNYTPALLGIECTVIDSD